MMTNAVMFAQALADATRWRIIRLIADEPMCVCELADILGMPQSSVSSHVQVIKKSGMLESERCEKWMYYRVAEEFRPLLTVISTFFEVSESSETSLSSDAAAATIRMAQRDQSCCPLPKSLAKLRPITATALKKSLESGILCN